ncbi:glycosyltransferase family 4 protein [Candidatus Sumerlaeota bacterium]|nr:glycosyltransferase family 4 protein [Candidatus Sumerlaeota bacterium]
MHVGIDARMIGHSGIGVYLRELIRHLRRVASDLEITLFGRPIKLQEFEALGCRVVPYLAGIYGGAERRGWPREAARCDVLHAPHYSAPGRPPRPMVVTFHDLIHLLGPGALVGPRRWWARHLMSSALRSAEAIVCDSEATRRDLLSTLRGGRSKERTIRVIPLAAGRVFREEPDTESETAWRHEAGLPGRHWLTVGIDKPHKGHDFTLAAVARLGASADGRLPLVIVGPEERRFRKRHREALRLGGVEVIFPGWIEEERLPALYRGAVALLFPSQREGFGFPAIEALAAGCPVLAADSGALPEVVGEGGVLLPPDDAGAWAKAMERVAGDESHRRDLIECGRRRAEQFSWARTAAQMVEVYRRAAQRQR